MNADVKVEKTANPNVYHVEVSGSWIGDYGADILNRIIDGETNLIEDKFREKSIALSAEEFRRALRVHGGFVEHKTLRQRLHDDLLAAVHQFVENNPAETHSNDGDSVTLNIDGDEGKLVYRLLPENRCELVEVTGFCPRGIERTKRTRESRKITAATVDEDRLELLNALKKLT